jgi:hypothetical protein
MLLLSLLFLFPCQHGPWCDARTIEFDASETATSYTLYWKANNGVYCPKNGPGSCWAATVDLCPATCTYPCRDSCAVYIRQPSPGNIIYYSLTASNAAGESGH